MMTTTQQPSGSWPFDKGNAEVLEHKLEKLEKFVDETVLAMAESLGLSPEEALSTLIKVHAEMIGDLKGTIEAIGDEKLLRRVGSEKLRKEIEEVIKAISHATALDTVEITDIFSNNPGASVADVSLRLHRRSLIDRSYTS
ncbi:MAG: hypothetical protein WA435_07245 [Gallionellaceae bacterium]